MDANFLLEAVKRKYPTCAVVPEISIDTSYEVSGQLRRIDALMFDGSGMRTAIEIKTSIPDFRRETAAKVYPWRRVTHRFVYVMPEGLDWRQRDMHFTTVCGVWWVSESGVVTVQKNASINKYPEPLPYNVVTRLAYRAAGKEVDIDG